MITLGTPRGSKQNAVGATFVLCCTVAVFAIPPTASAQNPSGSRAQTPNRAQAASAAPAQAQRPAGQAAGDDIIARVGGANITVNEVRGYIRQLGARGQAALARDQRLLSQTIRLMLANQLVLKEALAKKWEQQPEVAAQLEKLRKDAIVETYLRSVSAPPDGFPSSGDVENVYESNKSSFLVPRQFHLAQIVIAAPRTTDKEALDKASRKLDEVTRKLKAPGADFAAIAKIDSDERESGAAGGDLGWLIETQIRPEIRTQIAGLGTNMVGDPVRLEDGWHILKLIETKAASTRTLAEVRDELTQRLRDDRAASNRRAYMSKLIEEAPPAINELALSKVFEGQAASSTK